LASKVEYINVVFNGNLRKKSVIKYKPSIKQTATTKIKVTVM
jgi:hypothetical protein